MKTCIFIKMSSVSGKNSYNFYHNIQKTGQLSVGIEKQLHPIKQG